LKNRLVLMFAAILVLMIAVVARADGEKTIVLKIGDPFMTVNGVKQEIDPGRGTTPVVISGRTLLPIRTLVENIGGVIAWAAETQQVIITFADREITLTLGSNKAMVRDVVYSTSNEVVLDVAPRAINGRTMVPVRFVGETLGALVDWNGQTQTVTVTFGVDQAVKPDSHQASAWGGTAHGITGRKAPDDCAYCHNDNEGPTYVTPSVGDKIADLARANSFCYSCHLQYRHEEIPVHSSRAQKNGLRNCFTCHDRNEPGSTATGTYCNICHWFQG